MKRYAAVTAVVFLMIAAVAAAHSRERFVVKAGASRYHSFQVSSNHTLFATVRPLSGSVDDLRVTMIDHHGAAVAHGHNKDSDEIRCTLRPEESGRYRVRVQNRDHHAAEYELMAQVSE